MIIKTNFIVEDTSKAKLQAAPEGLSNFKTSAFGLSIHWGLYALYPKGDEWVYYRNHIPFETYKSWMKRFNPIRFNAEEWADLVLESGLKFLLITTKHHDGFCMYDTALTEFKITRTPFKRDVIRELSTALRDRGLGLHFYYSLVDWTYPAYKNDWPAYVEYYQGQLRELCTNYGEIAGVIFDGYWPLQDFTGDELDYFPAKGTWDLAGTYDLIHNLQPNAVVANNTHVPPINGEDYQVWELDLPGQNTTGFNCTEIGNKSTASWWNLNTGWSYQPWRHAVRSVDEVVRLYQTVREKDAVFFLNVGPRPFGDIHPEEQLILRQAGQKIKKMELK